VKRPRYFIDGEEYETGLTIDELAAIIETKVAKEDIMEIYRRKKAGGGGSMLEFN
jgi:hypothetical protein